MKEQALFQIWKESHMIASNEWHINQIPIEALSGQGWIITALIPSPQHRQTNAQSEIFVLAERDSRKPKEFVTVDANEQANS